MGELRYNPLLQDWTMVASNRQHRPNMPKDYCPFCAGSGRVPDDYDVLAYDNDFPALSPHPPTPDVEGSSLYPVKESYGKCEVILYSSKHDEALSSLSVTHIRKVIDLWTKRFSILKEDPRHQYIFIFENRGREVGVTMPHPHGQIYAYPYVPQKLRVELQASQEHFDHTGECLICAIREEEVKAKVRILEETEHFVSFIPFFTDYPFGLFIVSKAHRHYLTSFSEEEKNDFAHVLKRVTSAMDELYGKEFPYMMAFHQAPVNTPFCEEGYHFHVEFYPPLREENRIKFLASSETGAWAPCNPVAVEDSIGLLREALQRIDQRGGDVL